MLLLVSVECSLLIVGFTRSLAALQDIKNAVGIPWSKWQVRFCMFVCTGNFLVPCCVHVFMYIIYWYTRIQYPHTYYIYTVNLYVQCSMSMCIYNIHTMRTFGAMCFELSRLWLPYVTVPHDRCVFLTQGYFANRNGMGHQHEVMGRASLGPTSHHSCQSTPFPFPSYLDSRIGTRRRTPMMTCRKCLGPGAGRGRFFRPPTPGLFFVALFS